MLSLAISLLLVATAAAEENSVEEVIKGNNAFAAVAYKEVLNQHNGNILVSPFSAETILAFAQSGCKGETAQELRNALHLPDDQDKIEVGIKTLLPQMKGNGDYSLHTANKMYVKEAYPIKEEFKTAAKEIYHADSENIDFTKREEAAEKMNTWVEENTNNKIHNLVDPDKLTNKSRVVLINALYFKGDWKMPFLLEETRKKDFYRTASDVIKVDTMHYNWILKRHFKYYECPNLNAKFLELPFKGEGSMTIILPNEKEGLAGLENQIDKVFTPHNLTGQLVNIALPKFKIETKVDFKKILKRLGVTKAFDEDFADLSGISGKKGELLINDVVQKSFIDVGEVGVEAAAATHVSIEVPLSALRGTPKDFIADHPFIFYIKVKDVIIFAGRVTDPK